MPVINGTPNDDTLPGTPDDDTINALAGDDLVSGEGGDDSILAADGNDTVFGDEGSGTNLGLDGSPLNLISANAQSSNEDAQVGDEVVYSNVSQLADGTPISGRLILISTSDPDLPVNMTGPNDAEIRLNTNSEVAPGATATFRLEFFDPATGDPTDPLNGDPVALNSTATVNDIDRTAPGDQESVALSTSTFDAFGTTATTSLDLVITDDSIRASGTEVVNPDDQDAWFSAEFENREFIEFTFETRLIISSFSFSGDLIDDPVITPIEAGDDTIEGGDGDDQILGQGGDDSLRGDDGDDTLDGGEGADTLVGGDGEDSLVGGGGADSLVGGDDNDLLFGNGGDDTIRGGDGDDSISASEGDDVVFGGAGDDLIVGEFGDDFIAAGGGYDTVLGGDNDDTLIGQSGNDSLVGGGGDDSIRGGGGRDFISGGEGDDTLRGGSGNDTIDLGEGDNSAFGSLGSDLFTVDALGNTTVVGGEDPDDGDTDVLDLTGVRATVTETGFEAGFVELFDDAGNLSGRIDYTEIERIIICFTPGTQIATQKGEVPVERLKAGDSVITRDNGIQNLRWVGHRDLAPKDMRDHPEFQPIRIRQGALGKGLPERDMLVSPQHRMLLTSDLAELLFEEREVLVAAKHLTSLDGIEQAHVEEVRYLHLMFDHHEVVLADGAWSESFQPGDRSLRGVGDEQRAEILALFPELASPDGLEAYGAARPSLKSHEASILLDDLK